MSTDQGLSRFAALLVNETADFIQGSRCLDATIGAAAVLDEVDQTVLGTSLRFHAGDAFLELAVQGRRIICVQDASDQGLASLSGQFLKAGDSEEQGKVCNTITLLAQAGSENGRLSVETGALPDSLQDVAGHVSISMLEAAGEQEKPAAVPLTAQGVAKAFNDYAQAMAWFDGTQIATSYGEQELVTELMSLAKVEARAEPLGRPSLTVVEEKFAGGLAVAIVNIDDNALVFAVETESLFDLAGDFQQMMRA